jgi:hypothetical protein
MACRPFLSGGEFLFKDRIAIADDPALPEGAIEFGQFFRSEA